MFFFFNEPATTGIYTLSLHDALPISSSLFFDTVKPAFNGLASPANLQALANAMAYNTLEGVVMLIDGSASGKAEVDLGQSLALGDVGLRSGVFEPDEVGFWLDALTGRLRDGPKPGRMFRCVPSQNL